MSARDDLASFIRGRLRRQDGTWWHRTAADMPNGLADDLLAAGWSRPRVVTAASSDWRVVVASDPDHFEQLYERDGFEGQALCIDGGGTYWLLAATEDGPWFLRMRDEDDRDTSALAVPSTLDGMDDLYPLTIVYQQWSPPVESGETQGGAERCAHELASVPFVGARRCTCTLPQGHAGAHQCERDHLAGTIYGARRSGETQGGAS